MISIINGPTKKKKKTKYRRKTTIVVFSFNNNIMQEHIIVARRLVPIRAAAIGRYIIYKRRKNPDDNICVCVYVCREEKNG